MKLIYLSAYMATWCGFCTSFKPIWNRLISIINEPDIVNKLKQNNIKIFFSTYDDNKDNEIIKKANITSYPTIRVSIVDDNVKKDFELDPEDREPSRFLNAILSDDVKEIKQEILDKYNQQSGGSKSNYYLKYIKYKNKYLALKNKK